MLIFYRNFIEIKYLQIKILQPCELHPAESLTLYPEKTAVIRDKGRAVIPP